jgi:putative N6-adenine-specific DNA methylase
MFAYQQHGNYFAVTAEGLEDASAAELRRLGAGDIRPTYRGLHFAAERETLYRLNYRCRLITRILAPLAAFACHSTDYLYRKAKLIPWKEIMGVDHTLAVFANLSNSKIRHSQYAALCVKDAVVDYFREDCGRRPNVERLAPDVWLNVFIENNRAVISLDTSGGSLHRRGYRREGVEAPMQETVAAAVIAWSEWAGAQPLVDPMCGSGTLLAEALMHHCRIPAGYLRARFGFERLPDFDRATWDKIRETENQGIRPLEPGLVEGGDVAPDAVAVAGENLRRLPHGSSVRLQRTDYRRRHDLGGRVIVCNPPYGIRLKQPGGIEEFYRELGDYLKQHCRGSSAFIYFGDRTMLKHIGLKPSWKRPLKNGGLDGRLAKFEMY